MEARTQTPTVQESIIIERVARIVSSVRGTSPDYAHLAAELEPAIPFDLFGVVLLRHDRQAVRVTVCYREGNGWVARYHQHPLVESKLERVLRAPITVVENHPDGLDGPPAMCGDALSGWPQLRTTLIAPLIAGDRVLGTLELGSTFLNTYADETLQRLIGAVVSVLAAAIESAQVGGSVEIQNRQRQALKAVSNALTSKMDLSTILNHIVDGVARSLNVASAIVTFDQRGGKLRLEAQSRLDPLILSRMVSRKIAFTDQDIIGYTLRRRQPCVSNDIYEDERFRASDLFTTELGMRSIFCYPLVTGTTVYGVLMLCSPEPGGFTPLKADILSLFASQATIAIHNGMLIESAQQRSRFQKAIEQLEQAYEQGLDEQEVLAHVRLQSERTFGISFRSLLHFISDHLLTRSERDLHTILQTARQEGTNGDTTLSPLEPPGILDIRQQAFSSLRQTSSTSTVPGEEDRPVHDAPPRETLERLPVVPSSQEESVALLTQTAEAALARAEVLSELSRLLTQIKQTIGRTSDAWFAFDLKGLCIYMNPAAEAFCGVHMATASECTIEDVFADLLPRIRNVQEVRTYLYDFTSGNAYRRDLRGVLAIEPIHDDYEQSNTSEDALSQSPYGEFPRDPRTSLLLDNAPSDQHYQLSRYPLYNQQGILIAAVLQVQDVTAQVRDEKNKAALLSSVSHDLRTPLTTIKAAVSGLLQIDVEWDEHIRREILTEIDAEVDHLGVLVDALVEMSRIEMGALVLDKEWCDIAEIVHSAIARLERALAGRPVRTSFQPNLPLVYVDHMQMERVFYNLLENALRHSQDHTEILVTVDILDESTPEVSQYALRARVIDHGYGVPVGERERIFRTFYGLNLRGSGLGLAICRGIIEAHQGHISVETVEEGGGSCFIFTLPLHLYHGPSVGTQSVFATEGQE